MYQFSDSDSKDSEDGIRFKTDSTRNKTKSAASSSRRRSTSRSRHRDSSNRDRRKSRRSRSRSSDSRKYDRHRRRNRSRSRSRTRTERKESRDAASDSLSLSDEEVKRKEHPLKRKSPEYRKRNKHSRKRQKEGGSRHQEKSDAVDTSERTSNSADTSRSNGTKPVSSSDLKKTSLKRNTPSSSSRHSEQDNSHTKHKEIQETQEKAKDEVDLTADQPEVSVESNNDSVALGPALPPHLLKKASNVSEKRSEEISSKEDDKKSLDVQVLGPVLPSTSNSDIKELKTTQENADNSSTNDTATPVLPTEANVNLENPEPSLDCIGPTLPPHLREKLLQAAEEDVPVVEEDDEDAFGPLPPGVSSNSAAQRALEERALQMRLDSLNPVEKDVAGREEWMLELPEVHAANLGLGPRQFRAKSGPDMSDRSSWTDTPTDKAKKKDKKTPELDLKQLAEKKAVENRDKQQEEIIRKHKKSKQKSLLAMHQDDLKKNKNKEENAGVRRPFSRDIDLKVNRFDEAQKKAIFKKAQLLDDRFSKGQSKFL